MYTPVEKVHPVVQLLLSHSQGLGQIGLSRTSHLAAGKGSVATALTIELADLQAEQWAEQLQKVEMAPQSWAGHLPARASEKCTIMHWSRY